MDHEVSWRATGAQALYYQALCTYSETFSQGPNASCSTAETARAIALHQSFGFRVSGFGFRVSGLRLRLLGFGFEVSGFGFLVSGFELRVSCFGVWFPGLGSRVSLFELLVSRARFPVFDFLILVSGRVFRVAVAGFRDPEQT